ncbi:CCA tRNA nucleotidyltransferase, partial [Lactobacillus parabuchneri]|nr:CCA tRNA nucleotidyltransferase [Lentilactobacillus parabuchneri]
LGEHEQALKQLANSPLSLQNEVQVWSLLAFTFGFSRGQISSFLKKWKTANKIINDVILTTELLFAIKKQQVTNWLLYQTGAANITNAIDVFGPLPETQTLMSRYAELPIKTKKQLQITGGQLIQQGVLQPGPELGKILDYLERAVVDGQIPNNFDDLKAAAVNFLNED